MISAFAGFPGGPNPGPHDRGPGGARLPRPGFPAWPKLCLHEADENRQAEPVERQARTAGLAAALVMATPLEARAQAPASPQREPAASPRSRPEVEPYATLSTGFGGGARRDARVGVLGGEVLLGVGVLVGHWDAFVAVPSFGWSGWRALDAPSRLRANTFTTRLDLGWFNIDDHYQGLTISGAGKFGTGRGPEPTSGPRRLLGAQVGVMWWPYRGVVGLEFQTHFTHYRGAWHEDFRAVVNVNLLWAYLAVLEAIMAGGR